MTANSTKDPQDIYALMTSLETAPKPSWVAIATVILTVEQSQLWRDLEYRSLNPFVDKIARKLNLEASLLWRHRKALLFLKKRKADLNLDSSETADFKQLERISPENLELCDKISRVLPDREMRDLVDKVLSRQIGRRELLEKWHALRNTLQNKTARGKGQEAPSADPNDAKYKEVLYIDKAITKLQQMGSEGLGIKTADRYLIMRSSSFTFLQKYGVDAIAVVQRTNSDSLEFHGIEIRLLKHSELLRYNPHANIFDYSWLIIQSRPLSKSIKALPKHLGIVIFDDFRLNETILREAKQVTQISIPEKLLLFNDILLHLLPN